MISRSPFLCRPLNVPFAFSEIGFWKNQKPCCASPLLSKRSEPKYSTSHVVVPGAGLGHAVDSGSVYRAANASWRLSLSGRPPDWSFHFHELRSCWSFEPPVVKIVAFCAPSLTNDVAFAVVLGVQPAGRPVS